MDTERKRGRPRSRPAVGKTSTSMKAPKTPPRSRSRGRPKNKGRARSKPRNLVSDSDRSTSPPKSRGRSKSPASGKRSKSKSRKAPSRAKTPVKTKAKEETINAVSHRKLNIVLTDLNLEKDKLNDVVRRSLSRDVAIDEANVRRSSRLSNLVRDSDVKKRDVDIRSRAKATESVTSSVQEFGGWPGAVTIIFSIPLLALALHLACTKDQCVIGKFHIPRNWRVYFNYEAAGLVVGFLLLQVVLSILPIGRRVDGPPGRNGTMYYRCNGLLSAILTVGIVAGLWYLKYPVTIVYERLIPLLVSASLLGPLFGLVLYIKGGRAPVPGLNPYGMTGNRVYDFFVGREINPLFWRTINVKNVLLRSALIGSLILNGLFMLKSYEARNEWSYTLLTNYGMMALLVIEFLWFEESFSTTFEAMYEGCGSFICQTYLLYPFLSILGPKYIIQHRIELPIYNLALIVFFFLFGYFIFRASNLQKAAFRKNPLNPALAHFETIPTTRGKKLLVAGWWGWVRHPNYLGDIILQWAWAATAGCANILPYALPAMTTLILIQRAKRDNNRCKQRYMSSWDEYCRRVEYSIFPRLY